MTHRELCAGPFLAALLLLGAACTATAGASNGTGNNPGDPGGGGTGGCTITTPAETFTAADAPRVMDNSMRSPWGYDKAENAERTYPVVAVGCFYEIENWPADVFQKYPFFQLNWNNRCSSEQDGVDLASVIDQALADGYRIDPNRIYLTGFSQGGSGSYKILRGVISKGRNIAGLIRCAGQSETVLPDASVTETSVWYHVGLNDDPTRVQVAKDAYAYVKSRPGNAGAVETTVTDTAGSYSRTTKTLTKDGIAIFRLSTYPGVGHDPIPAYTVPQSPAGMNVYDWLFAQSLACR